MPDVLRQLLTGRDNVTHDLGRWSWAGSFAAVVLDAIGLAYGLKLPSVLELSTALGAVAGAHSAALFFKRDTEPKETP